MSVKSDIRLRTRLTGAQTCITFLNRGEKSEEESEVDEDEDNFFVVFYRAFGRCYDYRRIPEWGSGGDLLRKSARGGTAVDVCCMNKPGRLSKGATSGKRKRPFTAEDSRDP